MPVQFTVHEPSTMTMGGYIHAFLKDDSAFRNRLSRPVTLRHVYG